MILLSHPTGNQNVRQAALALAEAGLLAEFHTCLSWPAGRGRAWLPARLAEELERRSFPPSLSPSLRTHPWREAARLLAQRLGLAALYGPERAPFNIDQVYRSLDRQVAAQVRTERGLTGVYAYEDAALETFRAAAEIGARRFYDLPTGHWRFKQRLLEEEAQRMPEWAATLRGAGESEEKLRRKEAELREADHVVVASAFVQRTLEEVSGVVHVIPYGAPPVLAEPAPKAPAGPLRVLYVGSIGQQKGIAYLLQAVARLKGAAELTLVGRPPVAEGMLPRGELERHRWLRSLPHARVLAEMARHHVFVFPTLFDGFGLVLLEAMSRGLLVIATPHSGGPEVIEQGRNGFLVPIRSAEAIAEKLELLAGDRKLAAEMSHAALRKAAQMTWSHYRARLREIVPAALGGAST